MQIIGGDWVSLKLVKILDKEGCFSLELRTEINPLKGS